MFILKEHNEKDKYKRKQEKGRRGVGILVDVTIDKERYVGRSYEDCVDRYQLHGPVLS